MMSGRAPSCRQVAPFEAAGQIPSAGRLLARPSPKAGCNWVETEATRRWTVVPALVAAGVAGAADWSPSAREPRFGRMEFQQGFPHGLRHQPPHLSFLVEFHLALGRMDIHIHRRRIDFQKQAADRITAFHQRRVIAFQQGKIQSAILHRPAVDEQMLVLARGARNARRAR